jgi:hypothetical protein
MKQCEQSSTTKNKHFQEFDDVFCSSNLFVSGLLLLAALGVVAIFKLPCMHQQDERSAAPNVVLAIKHVLSINPKLDATN